MVSGTRVLVEWKQNSGPKGEMRADKKKNSKNQQKRDSLNFFGPPLICRVLASLSEGISVRDPPVDNVNDGKMTDWP